MHLICDYFIRMLYHIAGRYETVTFFLLVAVLVAASIFVLYRGLRAIRCPVTYTALVVAVLLSVAVTFLGVRFIPFLTDAFYWSMAVMVLLSALFTTLLDAYLLRFEEADASAEPQETVQGALLSRQREQGNSLSETSAHASAPMAEALTATPNETAVAAEAAEATAAQQTTPPAAAKEKPLAVIRMYPSAKKGPAGDAGTQAPASAKTAAEIMPQGALPVDAAADDVTAAPTEAAMQTDAAASTADAQGDAPKAPPSPHPVSEELEAELSSFRTLDDYLDFAFQEERGGRTENAIDTYKRAMAFYADDDYAPFIAIELANVCKELGDFQAAADALETGLHFPSVQASPSMAQEFRKNVRFLSSLRRVLEDAGISRVPLRQVPRHWQDMAEEMAKDTTSEHLAQAPEHG